MGTAIHSVPGVYNGRGIKPRNVFYSGQQTYFPSLAKISGSLSRDPNNSTPGLIRAGVLLGKTTATGDYRTTILGVTSANAASGAVAVTVSAASAVEIQRLKTLGGGGNLALKLVAPPTSGGTVAVLTLTVTAVDTSTGVLTVSAIGAAAVAGSAVVPSDGAETPVQVQSHDYGVDVVDVATGLPIDHQLKLVRTADYNTDNFVDYSSLDSSVKAYFKAAIKAAGAAITFKDDR